MINHLINNPNFQNTILNLFNKSIKNDYFPNNLKISKVIPVPKVPNPILPIALRPIAIQPVLAKLFEKCLCAQLSVHFFNNGLISKGQFGFRPKHSTSHALLAITDFM